MISFLRTFFGCAILAIVFFAGYSDVNAVFCPTGPEFADCFPTSQAASYGINLAAPPVGVILTSCTDARTSNATNYTCISRSALHNQNNLPACPSSGATCRPYGEVGPPGPILGGWTGCVATNPSNQQTSVYACCTAGYNTNGYCMSLTDWVDYAGDCCESGQTSCSVGGQPGYCAQSVRANDICSGNGHCEVAPVDTTNPGSFNCNCTNNGANWVCNPSFNSISGTLACASWAVPDTGRCSTTLPSNQLPSFCNRSDGGRCSATLPCVSQVTTPTNPLKQHGEVCNPNAATEECNTASGLHCRSVDGGNYCAYDAGSRGGPSASSSQSSCLFEDECVTQIGIDTSPANDYQCTSSPGVACDRNIATAGCSCRPPEGTWCGPGGNGTDCPGTTQPSDPYDICASNLSANPTALSSCQACMGAKGVWTAVGCISQDPKDMVTKLVTIGVGILGGIFLLRVLAAGFTLTISQGDVKRTTEAKEMITESVIGVLFILFSVTILQFIGSGVLRIPGFG